MTKAVILAEKTSVARNIAEALNIKGKKDGYYEGDQYIVTWAFGHLLQLYDGVYTCHLRAGTGANHTSSVFPEAATTIRCPFPAAASAAYWFPGAKTVPIALSPAFPASAAAAAPAAPV